jgi:uncharacterized protein
MLRQLSRPLRVDESGVDVQVLSVTAPALHNLEPEESVTLARRTNDLVAATIAKYRTRFQGFATLPTAAPEEAAAELERAVTRLGLVGTMLCGRTREKNLDHPDFLPIFETAARLGVPLFVHPQMPQRAVMLGESELDKPVIACSFRVRQASGAVRQFPRVRLDVRPVHAS